MQGCTAADAKLPRPPASRTFYYYSKCVINTLEIVVAQIKNVTEAIVLQEQQTDMYWTSRHWLIDSASITHVVLVVLTMMASIKARDY